MFINELKEIWVNYVFISNFNLTKNIFAAQKSISIGSLQNVINVTTSKCSRLLSRKQFFISEIIKTMHKQQSTETEKKKRRVVE